MATMRVHAVQLSVDFAETPADRIERTVRLVRGQAGADLVVLPELWVQGAFGYATFPQDAEPLDGPVVAALSAAARDVGAWLHGGSIAERAEDGRLYNTCVVFSPDGALAATYRKIHLFGFSGGETTVLSAGTDPVTVDIDGVTTGLVTCYDLRFPELFRSLIDKGAGLFLVPAGWPDARVAHWSLLARARAVEDQAFVVGVNGVGAQGRVTLAGRSVIVDPWGAVLAEGGTVEDVLVAELDIASIAKTRADFPVLKDRRLR